MNWKRIGMVVAGVGVVGALSAVVGLSLLPKDYDVNRSVVIDAPPEVIWDHVVILENHETWSPWQAMDPTTVNTYSGPEGVGHTMEWDGEKTGRGSQDVIALSPYTRADMRVEFEGMGGADVYFNFEPVDANSTTVTWGLAGTNEGLTGGLFAALMDSFIGADYEDGLARLKTVVESEA